ncbi:hypothetical protein [Thermus tengchongensis]|nr:hypothetical protein [Thermus tengchongensis]
MELERLRLEAEREKARQASIQVQPVAPTSPWVWALLAAVLAVLLLAVLLRD